MVKRVAVGWFPAGQYEQAVALWPQLVAGWNVSDYREYTRAVDHHLRELELLPDHEVLLAPIELQHYLKWCAREVVDSAAAESRTTYAMEVVTRGRGRPWPPPAGKRCWCGRDEPYETCCGA